MFETFSTMFSAVFIAFGIAAVIGHALLIDALLGPSLPRAVKESESPANSLQVPSAG